MISENVLLSKPTSYSIGDSVYYTLRKNIITLNLKPGEPLNVKNISDKLNVSRTPVRDALIKLGKEGLVDVIPQKGTSVSQIDLKRVEEERFLRGSLEIKALELFMASHKESDIARLKNNIEMQRECVKTGDNLSLMDYDDEFHRVFFNATEKDMCWDIIQSMSGHYRRVRLLSLTEQPIIAKVIDQHQKIINSIIGGNLHEVTELFKDHSTRILIEEQGLMEKYPEYFKQQGDDNFLIQDFLRMM